MPIFTPTNLRRSNLPRKSFSHEQLLEICHYYQNLLYVVRGIQGRIDGILDEFHRSQHGRHSEPLTRLLTSLGALETAVLGTLHDEITQVEVAAARWEGKSSKLRSEAKRQQRIRNERALASRGGYAGTPKRSYALDGSEWGQEDHRSVDDPVDPFNEPGFTPPSPEPVPVSPTFARALRGMQELPLSEPPAPPDTSGYKKSGLV